MAAVISEIYGRKAADGLNWITFIAMTAFHIGAVAAFFYIDPGAILAAVHPVVGLGQPRHRHGAITACSPTAASRRRSGWSTS